MKRLVVLVVIVAVAAIGLGLLLGREDGPPRGTVLYGNVDIREVALAFRQPGRIAALDVEEGDVLAAGDPVAELDDEPLRETLVAAEARVAVARARLDLLERGARPQEIQQAQAAVDEAEARLLAAERDLERKSGLAGDGAASELQVEAARERRDTAAARLRAAREALDLAREGFRREDVAAGVAELRLAEAQLEQARTALADARLAAPSAGTVLTRAREPGAMVGAGEPIAVLSLHEPVVVRAYVPEPQLGRVAPGTAVEVTTDGSARSYRGHVGFVSPRAEFTPKSVETPELRTALVYRLRILVADPDERLRQGMPVTVRILAGGSGGGS